MIIQFDPEYREYWKRWARFKPSTCTFSLFEKRLMSDHVYKRNVDTYIASERTEHQRQLKLEGETTYA